MITQKELIESVCISLNDFTRQTKERVKFLIPVAVTHIMSKHQWECTIRYGEFSTGIEEYVDLPDDFDKEIALYRSDYQKPLSYITPQKYVEMKAYSSTPYGTEAIKYTIMGGESLKRKRIYFLDPPSSDLTIKMFYNVKVDPTTISNLPDEFIPVIQAYLVFKMTPSQFEIAGQKQYNTAFGVARDDYMQALADLISHEKGQRGRDIRMELDDVAKNAYQYMHK